MTGITAPGMVTDLTTIGDTIPIGIRLIGITPGGILLIGIIPGGILRTGSLVTGTYRIGIMTGITPDGATGFPITIHTRHTRQTAIINLPTEQTTETHVA